MTIRLEQPSDFPLDAFRAFLQASPEQREILHRYMECSDNVQSVVRSMFAVLDNPHVTNEDRQRATRTIADALYLKPEEGHGGYGFDLVRVEQEPATKHPEEHRRPLVAQRLEQLDKQQATFSERLRSILGQKNFTQEELAERIDCTQSAISKMINRNSRPQKKTILKMAAALNVAPTELWPDLEVASILDTIADFPMESELTEQQAASLDAALTRPPVKVVVRELPKRTRK
jgi:transcriptional regulator with XRE-family HTH domain